MLHFLKTRAHSEMLKQVVYFRFFTHDNRVGIIILFVFLESCYPLEHSRSDTSLGNGKDSNADD